MGDGGSGELGKGTQTQEGNREDHCLRVLQNHDLDGGRAAREADEGRDGPR